MGKIINILKTYDANEIINELEKNKKISIISESDNFEIFEEELIIEEVSKNNLCINGNKDFKVGLDIEISDELKMEGIVRDLIRHVQNLRKESDYEVSDRINFAISCPSIILDSINQFEDYFKNETLISSIVDDNELKHSVNFKIDGLEVKISISKI